MSDGLPSRWLTATMQSVAQLPGTRPTTSISGSNLGVVRSCGSWFLCQCDSVRLLSLVSFEKVTDAIYYTLDIFLFIRICSAFEFQISA